MADANKVKFGLKNVHYAVATVSGSSVTYGTPKAIAGAVNLSLDAQGEETKYYNVTNNTGYTGDLEVAKFPDSFLADIFGITTDSNGTQYEDAEVEPEQFALLFEFAGDANKTRHCLYLCSCSRPALASGTITESKEPVTESVTINASPLPLDTNDMRIVRSKCNEGDDDYENWYQAVVQYSPVTT